MLKRKAPALAEASRLAWLTAYLVAALAAALPASDPGDLAAEALDAACGVDQLLLAGKERVAGSADFDDDVALVGGAGLELVAAGALDVDVVVLGVNSFFWHGVVLS